jgi:hypothetical protein
VTSASLRSTQFTCIFLATKVADQVRRCTMWAGSVLSCVRACASLPPGRAPAQAGRSLFC